MHSSTSSSRKIYFKTLLAIAIGMTFSLFLVKGFAYLNDASGDTILGRVLEAKNALPQIVKEDKDLVMVFGSSMVGAGFSPREFDQHSRNKGNDNLKSFNFGFGGLNPFFQDYLTRRIKDEFDSNNRRLKLTIIEFNPFQATVTRHNRAKALEDSFITMLGTEPEIRDILMQDPTRGVRLYNIKYLRDGISAEMVTNFLGRGFSTPRKRTTIEEDEELNKLEDQIGEQLNKAFEIEYPDFKPSNWSYDWQGGGTIAAERSKETLELFEQYYKTQNNPHRLDDDRLSRIHSADIIEMHFSEELIEAFIRIVNQFKTFSDHVEVVLLPRNTNWINYTTEGQNRLNRAIKQIEQATGVKIQNHQDLSIIKPTMFRDTTHLNRYQGSSTYTQFLAKEYSEFINNP